METPMKFLVIVLIIALIIGAAKICSQMFEEQKEQRFTGSWVDDNGNVLQIYYNRSSAKSRTIIYTTVDNETQKGIFSFMNNKIIFIWDKSADWWYSDYYFSDNGKTLTLSYPVFTTIGTEQKTVTYHKQ
jgi:hypothetical protein